MTEGMQQQKHLTSALSHTDDAVTLLCKQALQVGHQTMLPIHRKVDLWDQANVNNTCPPDRMLKPCTEVLVTALLVCRLTMTRYGERSPATFDQSLTYTAVLERLVMLGVTCHAVCTMK